MGFLITWLGEAEMHVLYLPLTAEQFTLPEFGGVKKLVESYDLENEIVGIMHVPRSETRFEFVFSKDDISPGELHKQYGDIL